MKFVIRMHQSGGNTPYSPDVDETFSLFLGSQRGDSDLTKDYRSVAGGSSADFNEIFLDGEVNKFGIRDLGGTRPHPRTRSYGVSAKSARWSTTNLGSCLSHVCRLLVISCLIFFSTCPKAVIASSVGGWGSLSLTSWEEAACPDHRYHRNGCRQ